jgi:hypothetical protein
MITAASQTDETSTESWQGGFMKMLPGIKRQARAAFISMDAEAREDAVSEVVANTMCAYKRLHERGELERAFISALTRYAIAQFHDGRRVGSPQCAGDVYSAHAKRKGNHKRIHLGTPGKRVGEWLECLQDNRITPVPDQVAFRIDFPEWLNSQAPRDKQIAERLSLGFSAANVVLCDMRIRARIATGRKSVAILANKNGFCVFTSKGGDAIAACMMIPLREFSTSFQNS